jgi:hypothetical protein
MSNIAETFKQPFLNKAEASVSTAVSIGWDGCHKIYVALDESSHAYFNEAGYEMVLVKDKDAALRQLHDWWESSCPLRFIEAVESDANTFHAVISQWDNYEEGKVAEFDEE